MFVVEQSFQENKMEGIQSKNVMVQNHQRRVLNVVINSRTITQSLTWVNVTVTNLQREDLVKVNANLF